MGIALAGHRNRNEMGCFIAGINPKGAASSLHFKVGDEILEVRNCKSKTLTKYNRDTIFLMLHLFSDQRCCAT